MTAAVGVDVGGTKCLGVAMVDGKVIAEDRRATPEGDALMATIASMMTGLAAHIESPTTKFGLGIAGLVGRDGVLHESPHLSLPPNTNVAMRLHDLLGKPVVVENDATAGAFAEWSVGAGMGARTCVCVTLGTGVGVGVVIDGEVLHGANGFVGEMGHMCIDRNGPTCKCGNRGCWELVASGSALSGAAIGIGLNSETLASDARSGRAEALAVFAEFADALALGLATVSYAFDPDVIVLGGGVSTSADVLIPLVQDRLGVHIYAAHSRPLPRVVAASLGERASAIGAALLA